MEYRANPYRIPGPEYAVPGFWFRLFPLRLIWGWIGWIAEDWET